MAEDVKGKFTFYEFLHIYLKPSQKTLDKFHQINCNDIMEQNIIPSQSKFKATCGCETKRHLHCVLAEKVKEKANYLTGGRSNRFFCPKGRCRTQKLEYYQNLIGQVVHDPSFSYLFLEEPRDFDKAAPGDLFLLTKAE